MYPATVPGVVGVPGPLKLPVKLMWAANGAAAVTLTPAAPLAAPLVARTVAGPVPLAGAGSRPLAFTDPGPPLSMDQVNGGCVARALPNWSLLVAANCCVAPSTTVALAGLTTTVVRVALTVTLTLLAADRPLASLMVTWN